MNVKVLRQEYTSLSTRGKLSVDGVRYCFTLEPPLRTDQVKPRLTPDGTYQLNIRWSYKFNRHVPHVENVPGFDAIEIHMGNFPHDTDGCTLVGRTSGPQADYIGQSVLAFSALMVLFTHKTSVTNPEEPNEKLHVWNVGQITYERGEK